MDLVLKMDSFTCSCCLLLRFIGYLKPVYMGKLPRRKLRQEHPCRRLLRIRSSRLTHITPLNVFEESVLRNAHEIALFA